MQEAVIQWLVRYAFYILCAYGIVLSFLMWNYDWLKENKWAHMAHLFIFIGLSTAMWHHVWEVATMPLLDLFYGLFKTGAVIMCNIYVFICMARYLVQAAPGAMMGDDQIRVPKTYDKAEAAERAQDWDLAASLYHTELTHDPRDAEAHRRLGNIYAKMGDYEHAGRHLTRASALFSHPDRIAGARMELADLYYENVKNPKAAADQLKAIVRDFPESRYAKFARERLKKWGQE